MSSNIIEIAIGAIRAILRLKRYLYRKVIICYLKIAGVEIGTNLRVVSLPFVRRHPRAIIRIGDNVLINNRLEENPAGIAHRSAIVCMAPDAKIAVGSNTGLSGVVLHAMKEITIGRWANIGAGTYIYDHDFHSLPYEQRRTEASIPMTGKAVSIGDDVFVGARSLILKGVTIGARAIIRAGSVVVSDIPEDCIAGGNPACVIKILKRT